MTKIIVLISIVSFAALALSIYNFVKAKDNAIIDGNAIKNKKGEKYHEKF